MNQQFHWPINTFTILIKKELEGAFLPLFFYIND